MIRIPAIDWQGCLVWTGAIVSNRNYNANDLQESIRISGDVRYGKPERGLAGGMALASNHWDWVGYCSL